MRVIEEASPCDQTKCASCLIRNHHPHHHKAALKVNGRRGIRGHMVVLTVGIRQRRRCGGWGRGTEKKGWKRRREDQRQRPALIANEAIESAIRYGDVTVMDSVGGCSSRKTRDTRRRKQRRTFLFRWCKRIDNC